MHEHSGCNWVTEVLQDIVSFLAMNEMKESSATVSAAAASIRLDIEARSVPPKVAVALDRTQGEGNILAFPPRRLLRS